MASYANAGALLSGYQWNTGTVTFSFAASSPGYYSASSAQQASVEAFSAGWQAAVREMLGKISAVANISFVETAGVGDMVFGITDLPGDLGGFGYYPTSSPIGGDVWIDRGNAAMFEANGSQGAMTPGGYRYWAIFHEILHAIGLEHPQAEGGETKHSPSLSDAEATQAYTALSYDRHPGIGQRPGDLQLYDIAALQMLYGARAAATGDTVYDGTLMAARSIWDTGGIDTLTAARTNQNAVIDLRQGAFSSIAGVAIPWAGVPSDQLDNISIAFGSVIENGIGGGGNDQITGNDADNFVAGGAGNDTLVGGAGNDMLDGGSGADTMSGGLGDDIYLVENDGDLVVELTGQGTDTVYVDLYDYTMPANVENLWYIGADMTRIVGNGLSNSILAGDSEDVVYGGAGNDIIDGASGDDSLYGGKGNDILIGGQGVDFLTGDPGADVFRFSDGEVGLGAGYGDYIMDFVSGVDRIDLTGMDANTGVGGDQAFTFIGTGAFSHLAGELRYGAVGNNTWLQGDTDGDGLANFEIILIGQVTPVATDFML